MSQPWVEKYRPENFNNIIMDTVNYKFLDNLITRKTLPNLLFYGPPGTGKTTTILNFIKRYQETIHNVRDTSLILHLNASDERGIDVVRGQIQQFVLSDSLITQGMKFVVLDEADYMTKNAQLALHKLIQSIEPSRAICICLICNYICKIEYYLQSEFIHLRFNKLPHEKVIMFLKKIINSENLTYSDYNLTLIKEYYGNDIRSMINHIQVNSGNSTIKAGVLSDAVCVRVKEFINLKESLFVKQILEEAVQHNEDPKCIVLNFLKYLLYSKEVTDNSLEYRSIIKLINSVTHFNGDDEVMLSYTYFKLSQVLIN